MGGFCGFILAGSFVGYVVPIICHLPPEMSAIDTTTGILWGPPSLVAGFVLGFVIVSVIQKQSHGPRSNETPEGKGTSPR